MDRDTTRHVASHGGHAGDRADAGASALLEIDHFDQWTLSTDAPTFSRMCATRIESEAVAV